MTCLSSQRQGEPSSESYNTVKIAASDVLEGTSYGRGSVPSAAALHLWVLK